MCGFVGAQMIKNLPAIQETQVQSLGQGDPLENTGNPLQFSCLENSMDREAWWAVVHGVAKSQTQLSNSLSLSLSSVGPFLSTYSPKLVQHSVKELTVVPYKCHPSVLHSGSCYFSISCICFLDYID